MFALDLTPLAVVRLQVVRPSNAGQIGNVYLHYALDVWFEREIRPALEGKAQLVRYADDFALTSKLRGHYGYLSIVTKMEGFRAAADQIL